MCGIGCGGGGSSRLGSKTTSFRGQLIEHEVEQSDGTVVTYTLDRRSEEEKKEDEENAEE